MNNKHIKGFTLVEVLVAMTTFFILITIIASVFTSALKEQRKILASQELINNTEYNLEYISRLLRMAKKDSAGVCIAAGSNYQNTGGDLTKVKFLNYNRDCEEIYYNSQDKRLYENKNGETLPLTSQNIGISLFNVRLRGATENDNLQPEATIILYAKSKNQRPEENTEIRVQTSISQRDLDQ